MALCNECWNFLVRVVRHPSRPHTFDRVQLIEITLDEERAAAMCAAWRADEPDDDIVCVGWRIMSGHYYKGCDCKPAPMPYRVAYLDQLAAALAEPVMQAIGMAVRAMQGEYGEDCNTISPDFRGGKDDEEYV